MKSVILMGATGATGSKILPLLLHEGKVGKVTAFLRKPIPDHEKLTQVIVKDFKKLEESTKLDQWNSDIIINALGSTKVMACTLICEFVISINFAFCMIFAFEFN